MIKKSSYILIVLTYYFFRSDAYDLPVGHTQNLYKPGQRSRPSPIKADHSLTLNLNYR